MSNQEIKLEYIFSRIEIEAIARFFRKNQSTMPAVLDDFNEAVLSAVYESMTVDDVEKFFNEK